MIVLCTAGSEQEAVRIADSLVEARLAACVNILPGIRSVYRWEGKVERAGETLLLIKTTGTVFPRLRARILELHSYEVPEILAVRIEEGLDSYLRWIREST